MIDIKRKEDCVGCNGCVQICPRKCIEMHLDYQGFQYPEVDVSKCVECGLCEKACPVINQNQPRLPEKVYAGWNEDEDIRRTSSSGGIFYELARKTIEDGGVVFGAAFNERWEVVHTHSDTIEGINAFKGSKYVQSRIGNTYEQVKEFLKDGRKVMFSGTPCQIAGLKRFLHKDYDEMLLTVDVVCHGVPSPGIWKEYLNYITRSMGASKNTESQPYQLSVDDISSIKGISFRDKRLGWEKFGIAIRYAHLKDAQNSESQSAISQDIQNTELFESHKENLYMQGFLKDLYLRPSCYECPAKCGKSHSDITLADVWGIRNNHPELHSEKGVSLLLANTKAGTRLLSEIHIDRHKVTYENAIAGNPAIEKSAVKPKLYDSFWIIFQKKGIKSIP